ncbi:MAG: tRNA 2-thiouridine(34) synthase MnmA [Treponema sp.]|jgi:tRNA-specific 2-thiouridylase|nr:tRNA 2-thiouridine(34) synthase MnmA [Treponema sp.]
MRVLIAMSGGVDSSAAAALTLDAGGECVGVTMKLVANRENAAAAGRSCCSYQDINDARAAAWKLGIPHYVLNYTEAFTRHVIEPFVESYERGETPNPCIECNRRLKFSLLLHRAGELEAARIVTGHYARIEPPRGPGRRWLLKKGRDPRKDQSYVLYMLSQEELARVSFPLGGLTKGEVRDIAESRGLANARKEESQDICFVPGGDYGDFMEAYRGKSYPPGDILDREGRVLGRHRGLVRYTLGQRRGLGVAGGVPLYVAAKDPAENTLTLGEERDLYSRSLDAGGVNLIAAEALPSPVRLGVKTRYLQKEQWARVEQTGPAAVHLEFEEPQRAVTPGQAAVFYDGETLVGGGTIESVRGS